MKSIKTYLIDKLGISARALSQNVSYEDQLSAEEGNAMIKQVLRENNPSMISRFGMSETASLVTYHQIEALQNSGTLGKLIKKQLNYVEDWDDSLKNSLRDLVGFFPTNRQNLVKFSEFYPECVKEIDAIGVWGFVPGESFIIKKFCNTAVKYNPVSLEPYYFDRPWSSSLKEKKVLVIHPFTHSIINQYKNRELLFKNQETLPEFDLETITAVQSIAGNKTNFKTWFEALNWMQNEIDKIEFDVALIGAGSYGIPLSAYVKRKGKIAIHMGGSLQLYFGIKGKRWDDHEIISKLYNKHWVRPSEDEIIPDAQKVEGACYW